MSLLRTGKRNKELNQLLVLAMTRFSDAVQAPEKKSLTPARTAQHLSHDGYTRNMDMKDGGSEEASDVARARAKKMRCGCFEKEGRGLVVRRALRIYVA